MKQAKEKSRFGKKVIRWHISAITSTSRWLGKVLCIQIPDKPRLMPCHLDFLMFSSGEEKWFCKRSVDSLARLIFMFRSSSHWSWRIIIYKTVLLIHCSNIQLMRCVLTKVFLSHVQKFTCYTMCCIQFVFYVPFQFSHLYFNDNKSRFIVAWYFAISALSIFLASFSILSLDDPLFYYISIFVNG